MHFLMTITAAVSTFAFVLAPILTILVVTADKSIIDSGPLYQGVFVHLHSNFFLRRLQ